MADFNLTVGARIEILRKGVVPSDDRWEIWDVLDTKTPKKLDDGRWRFTAIRTDGTLGPDPLIIEEERLKIVGDSPAKLRPYTSWITHDGNIVRIFGLVDKWEEKLSDGEKVYWSVSGNWYREDGAFVVYDPRTGGYRVPRDGQEEPLGKDIKKLIREEDFWIDIDPDKPGLPEKATKKPKGASLLTPVEALNKIKALLENKWDPNDTKPHFDERRKVDPVDLLYEIMDVIYNETEGLV